jgi:hypothetical protein
VCIYCQHSRRNGVLYYNDSLSRCRHLRDLLERARHLWYGFQWTEKAAVCMRVGG